MSQFQKISIPKKNKTLMYAIIGIVIVIVVIAVIGILLQHPSYSNTSPTTETIPILSSGTVESFSPGYYLCENFTIQSSSYNGQITGSYTSSADINCYVLTPVEFGQFTQNPGSNGYIWASGNNGGTTISASLPPGQYSLVFYNSNIFTPDTVTVISSIIAQYTAS